MKGNRTILASILIAFIFWGCSGDTGVDVPQPHNNTQPSTPNATPRISLTNLKVTPSELATADTFTISYDVDAESDLKFLYIALFVTPSANITEQQFVNGIFKGEGIELDSWAFHNMNLSFSYSFKYVATTNAIQFKSEVTNQTITKYLKQLGGKAYILAAAHIEDFTPPNTFKYYIDYETFEITLPVQPSQPEQ